MHAGRATNYGGEPHDRWSLDTGSCGRGKIDGPKLVTALNTDHTDNTVRTVRSSARATADAYELRPLQDKCGQCFEVRAASAKCNWALR